MQYGGERLQGVFSYLKDLGFMDFFLPFALFFALFFAILVKMKIFKKKGKDEADRTINGVLALVLSAIITFPHIVGLYPPGKDPVTFIMMFLPQSSVLLVAVLAILLLYGLSSSRASSPLTLLAGLVAAVLLVIVLLVNVFPEIIDIQFLKDPMIQALLIILGVMGLIGWFVMRPEHPGGSPPVSNVLRDWIGTERGS